MVDRPQTYEDAVERTLSAEKNAGMRGGVVIDTSGVMQNKEVFFASGEYAAEVAKINRLAAKGGDAVEAALGLQAHTAGEAVKRGIMKGFEGEIESLFAQTKQDIERIERTVSKIAGGVGERGGAAPARVAGKAGGVFPGVSGNEKAPDGAVARGGGAAKLVDLSIADQIEALERIALEFYDKSRGEAGLSTVRADVQELYRKVAGESAPKGSEFETRMIELRNRRLREVMERLDINNTS